MTQIPEDEATIRIERRKKLDTLVGSINMTILSTADDQHKARAQMVAAILPNFHDQLTEAMIRREDVNVVLARVVDTLAYLLASMAAETAHTTQRTPEDLREVMVKEFDQATRRMLQSMLARASTQH